MKKNTTADEVIASVEQGFQSRDIRALTRLISWAENGDSRAWHFLNKHFSEKNPSRVIGFTGTPGAGKSSLIAEVVKQEAAESRKHDVSLAVLAVDPISPFTGGALLGDRIRFQELFTEDRIFIRSLSTRGKLGGLSVSTRASVHLLQAFGMESIYLETVGVGQSEVDVHRIADVTVLVITPEGGDGIQALKSGVIEIADIVVVNKSDREGSSKLSNDVEEAVHLRGLKTKVLRTSLVPGGEKDSVVALRSAIDGFFRESADEIRRRRSSFLAGTAREVLEREAQTRVGEWISKHVKDGVSPYATVLQYLKENP